MAEYYVPARDSETEFTEKRSRFIGHVWRVETEEEAREKIAQMKAKYYDARHPERHPEPVCPGIE